MTFEKFQSIVKEKRPDVVVHKHGDFTTKATLGVAVIFNFGKSKVYVYNGTYCQILNRLNIPAVSKTDIFNIKVVLQHYKEEHGQPNLFFDGVNDFSQEIAFYEQELEKYKNYIIV